ncbi:exodeoxyribonuclease III [Synergistales bacterium]|nr:exodeoxyribonuclease III [Synergistales bacterium]
MTIKIATFNVNSIKARIPVLEHYLSDDMPDILCLQETKCADGAFPSAFFETFGYHAVFRGMKSYNGVAVISKAEPDEFSFGFADGGDSEEDACRLAVTKFGQLNLVCAYVPQGNEIGSEKFAYKLRFLERLRAMFDRRFAPSDLLLWAGDINVAPLDIDVTHPESKRDHVCVCEQAREALNGVLSWGLSDVLRKFRPGAGEFTFWDYRVKDALSRNIGWRIDHLFASAPLYEKSAGVYAARELRAMERPSDHTALIGVFDI